MLRRTALLSSVLCLLMLSACGGGSPGPGPGPTDGPVIHSLTPNAGPMQGGTQITIRGSRFAAGAAVSFGGRAATNVDVQSSDVMTARAPAGAAAGAVNVLVTVNGVSGSLPNGYTYVAAPQNALPVINSLTARGSRPRQPPNFADLGESLTVTANVTDEETSPSELEYHWSATLGTVAGSGDRATWTAPATADTPTTATLTLRVVERFGSGGAFQQEVSRTRVVALHDSTTEVGAMARRFLTEFSQPQTNQDWEDVMADFDLEGDTCPNPSLIEDEKDDVIDHYSGFVMHDYSIGAAAVTFNFLASCAVPGRPSRPGDACVSVPVMWDSTETATNTRRVVTGTDYLSAAYSSSDRRWWLCSSDFRSSSTFHSFYER
jgi:hypothetical protein